MKLLNDTEAALYLQITKELLYAYTSRSTNGQILKTTQSRNAIFFSEETLKTWDQFLSQPWTMETKRIKPPQHIRDYLKIEAGGQCARCGNGGPFDDAHIVPWQKSKSNHHHNLVRLCKICHKHYDDGIISRTEIKEIKAERIQRLQQVLLGHPDMNFISLRRMPSPDNGFKGRETEISSCLKSITNNSLTMVCGVGGIGKTQLALHSLIRSGKEVIWFNVEQFQSFKDLQLSLLTVYEASSLDELVIQISSREEILVFDGYEKLVYADYDGATEFVFNLLSHASKVTILITTQLRFADTRFKIGVITVVGLPPEERIVILNDFTENKFRNDPTIEKLCYFSDGHPLTLRIIAGLLDFFGSSKNVLHLIKRKGSKSLTIPCRNTQTKSSSLELCLQLVFEQLNLQQKWLLKYIACYQVGIKEPMLEILCLSEQNSKSKFSSTDEVYKIVAELKRFSIVTSEIDVLGVTRISLLNPIKAYLAEMSKTDISLAHTIQIEAFTHLLITAHKMDDQYMLSKEVSIGIISFDIELPNYLYAIKKSVHSAYCTKCQMYSNRKEYLFLIKSFASSLYKFLFTRGYFQYGIYVNEQGTNAHIEMEEYAEAVEDLIQVAAIYRRTSQYGQAQDTLSKIHECIEKSGEGQCYPPVYALEGELIRDKDPFQAIKVYQQGVKVAENNLRNNSESVTDRGNLACLLSEIGLVYERYLHPNNPIEALEYYKKSYDIHVEIKDYANLYCTSHHIANCYSDLGDVKNAFEFYRDAMLGFINTGQDQYLTYTIARLERLKSENLNLDLGVIATKKVLEVGLTRASSEFRKVTTPNTNSDDTDIRGNLHFKQGSGLFSIVKLISFTDHTFLLRAWSAELLEYVERKNPRIPNYPWFFLKIAQLIPQVEEHREDEDLLTELKSSCYLFGGEVEHDIYDPFGWLARWLHFKNIITTTRGKLFADVEQLIEEDSDGELEI